MPNAGIDTNEEENSGKKRLGRTSRLSSLRCVVGSLRIVCLLLARVAGASVLSIERIEGLSGITDTGTSTPTDFVKGEQSVHLHDGEVVTEGDEGRDVNDVLGTVPQVRQKLEGTSHSEPSHIGQDDFPDGKMVVAFGSFHAEIGDEDRSDEQGQGIEQFVNHGVSAVRVGSPDVTFHEERPEIRTPRVSRPSQDLQQEAPVGFHGREEF